MEVQERRSHDPREGFPSDLVILLEGFLVVSGVHSQQTEHQLRQGQAGTEEDKLGVGVLYKGQINICSCLPSLLSLLSLMSQLAKCQEDLGGRTWFNIALNIAANIVSNISK